MLSYFRIGKGEKMEAKEEKLRIKVVKAYIHIGYCEENGERCTAPLFVSAIEFITEDGRFLTLSLNDFEYTTNII